jgi:hypothetical protein
MGQPLTGQPNAFPRDLAEAVHSELIRRKSSECPQIEVLTELFEAMYFASLKREEAEAIAFHIVFLNPAKPDPKPPKNPPHDRWSCVSLTESVLMRSKNFIKMAAGSHLRTSSFAVYPNSEGHPAVWGLVDQGNRYHDYVNLDSESGPERPGLFQASVTGVGHLVAYIDYDKIAELRINVLVRRAVDVLADGAVSWALEPGVRAHHAAVAPRLAELFGAEGPHDTSEAPWSWLSSIRRLLLRVQNLHHGGAFLITNDSSVKGLSIKYGMKYDRIRSALERLEIAEAENLVASTEIGEEYMDKDADELPVRLHLDEAISGYDVEDIRRELNGTIWFVSLLTRVDGLVLLNQRLEVIGFGVEITTRQEPSEVFIADDIYGTESRLRRVDYQLYGTRHRSMMRYCSDVPGSIGFVVSQDGDVRVMTKVNGRLIVWENIQLQLPAFVRPAKKKRRT